MASWIITKDKINKKEDIGKEWSLCDNENGEVGRWSGNKEYIDAGKCKHAFRLLDDDGVVYFYGKSGNSGSFAPLDQCGSGYGCTEIQYFVGGRWETL